MKDAVLLKEPLNLLEFLAFVQALYDEGVKQKWTFVLEAFGHSRPWGFSHPPTEEIMRYTAGLRLVTESPDFKKIKKEVQVTIEQTHRTLDQALAPNGWKQPPHWVN